MLHGMTHDPDVMLHGMSQDPDVMLHVMTLTLSCMTSTPTVARVVAPYNVL